MKKIFILLFAFSLISCKNEEKKKETISASSTIPIIKPKDGSVVIDSLELRKFNSKILEDFYKTTGYLSIWKSKKDRKIVLEQLSKSDEEGLNPNNYNIKKIKKLEEDYKFLTNSQLANFDILITYNLQKYIKHLTNGRLNPRQLYADWDLPENKIDLNTTILQMLKKDSINYKIENLKPNHIVYKSLKKALILINSFPKDNFKSIPFSNKLVLNDTNSTLIDIKKRLIYWKDMKPKDSLSMVYDSETLKAIKKYQFRHGLSADGIIGKGTLESLNFSRKERKEQIIANLERWKWFPKEMGNEYCIVNIPAYKLNVVKDRDTIRTYNVIVGKAERKTPVLSSRLSTVVFNPTWTIPPTILKEDVIPAIEKDRGYLEQKNIKVYDKNDNEITANKWKLANANGYRYVQSPGTFNSLGMVKILFSNRFSVYLHDTNHRDYFGRNMRSLSSGCVRVEKPLELSEYVLNDTLNWNLTKITETLTNEKTKYIKVKKKIFIQLLYWTAWSEKNTLIFRDDIYQLDSELYKKLGN